MDEKAVKSKGDREMILLLSKMPRNAWLHSSTVLSQSFCKQRGFFPLLEGLTMTRDIGNYLRLTVKHQPPQLVASRKRYAGSQKVKGDQPRRC